MNRILLAAAAVAFLSASGIVALTRGTSVLSDAPARQVTHPTPDLELTTSLDHSRLAPGTPLHLSVELKNVGASPVYLAPASGCANPALLTAIQDAQGHIVWSQPVPQLGCFPQYPSKPVPLFPGQSLSGSFCWQRELTGSTGCAFLDLAAGAYRVSGSFYRRPLPESAFQVTR